MPSRPDKGSPITAPVGSSIIETLCGERSITSRTALSASPTLSFRVWSVNADDTMLKTLASKAWAPARISIARRRS
jgi:hypothetical protein